MVWLIVAAAFFVTTSSGIRGVYEVAVVAPFIIRRTGLPLTVGGLLVYPVLLLKFHNLEAIIPHLLDWLWAIR